MKRRGVFTFFALSILLLGIMSVTGAKQLSGLAEVATGEGTLTSSSGARESIKAVAVFLRENGEAEIWLMTNNENVYAGGRWSRSRGSSEGRQVDLEITDDTDGRSVAGCGTLILQEACVPLARLTMSMSSLDGTSLEANFKTNSNLRCSKP